MDAAHKAAASAWEGTTSEPTVVAYINAELRQRLQYVLAEESFVHLLGWRPAEDVRLEFLVAFLVDWANSTEDVPDWWWRPEGDDRFSVIFRRHVAEMEAGRG
jgi:ABC-type nitrate/sulfonate/bicarbonate transport system substrate-binding protein